MSDIIYLKPVEFHQLKHLAADENIIAKYKALFAQYNCFSEQAVVLIQNAPAKHASKKYPSSIKREHKTVKRAILGILNVINDDNYKKMLIKTKILINSENIVEIFNEILEKCVYQVFYLSIYFQFINDLLHSLSENERNTAKQIIRDFVTKFQNQEYILDIPKTDDNYHDFCTVQKNKLHILSKNQIAIQFICHTDYMKDICLQSFADKIFNTMLEHINKNNEIADVLLHMMIELKKQNCIFDKEKLKTIKTTNKLQFHINDIVA